ncbi:MAG TPA: ornithine carbamoyltransferase [Actinomycetota bacterium]|nr:ornithine carbamoyltransferase [Actinomycetota bacterium]
MNVPAGLRHFLSIGSLEDDELAAVLGAAARAKADPVGWARALDGKQVAMLFEQPSTRTKVSFEVAVTSMGGNVVALDGARSQIGRGETIEDTARVMSRYVDAVVLRTTSHDRLEAFAGASEVPVINALTELEHPCQVLSDLLTITESKGRLRGTVIAYLGDGNNVTHSLLLAAAMTGMELRVATPLEYQPLQGYVDAARARDAGASIELFDDPKEAARNADVVYTDVWVSMGMEDNDHRRSALAGFQINDDILTNAATDVVVMHCLPAHRGEEITDDIIDGPRSIVWEQAENRLHAQKALLAKLLP